MSEFNLGDAIRVDLVAARDCPLERARASGQVQPEKQVQRKTAIAGTAHTAKRTSLGGCVAHGGTKTWLSSAAKENQLGNTSSLAPRKTGTSTSFFSATSLQDDRANLGIKTLSAAGAENECLVPSLRGPKVVARRKVGTSTCTEKEKGATRGGKKRSSTAGEENDTVGPSVLGPQVTALRKARSIKKTLSAMGKENVFVGATLPRKDISLCGLAANKNPDVSSDASALITTAHTDKSERKPLADISDQGNQGMLCKRLRYFLPPPLVLGSHSLLIDGIEQLAAQSSGKSHKGDSPGSFGEVGTLNKGDSPRSFHEVASVEAKHSPAARVSLPRACSYLSGLQASTLDRPWLPRSQAGQAMVLMSVRAALADVITSEPRLVDLSTGMVHTLPMDGIVDIGRAAACDVVVPFGVVDERHCVLICASGNVQVEDVGEQGTFVNETQVPKGIFLPQHVPLRCEDRIALSDPDGPKLLFLAGRATSAREESAFSFL